MEGGGFSWEVITTSILFFFSLYAHPLLVASNLYKRPDDLSWWSEYACRRWERRKWMPPDSWELYLNLSHLKQSQLQAAQLRVGRPPLLSQHACFHQLRGEAHAAFLKNCYKHQSCRKHACFWFPQGWRCLLEPLNLLMKPRMGFLTRICAVHAQVAPSK